MQTVVAPLTSPLSQGKTAKIASEAHSGAGVYEYHFGLDADVVLVSLFVASVVGTVDVEVITLTEDGKEFTAASFPTVSAPTSNLVLKRAVNILSRVKLKVTFTGACSYEIYARGIGAGEADVRVLGSADARASQTTAGSGAPTLLIGASLQDRAGIALKNNTSLGGPILYIGFTTSEATSLSGYPLQPGESLGMNIGAGVEVYGLAASGTIDVRILEAGG